MKLRILMIFWLDRHMRWKHSTKEWQKWYIKWAFLPLWPHRGRYVLFSVDLDQWNRHYSVELCFKVDVFAFRGRSWWCSKRDFSELPVEIAGFMSWKLICKNLDGTLLIPSIVLLHKILQRTDWPVSSCTKKENAICFSTKSTNFLGVLTPTS